MHSVDQLFDRSIPIPFCGCWVWDGAWDNYWGYGFVWVNGKNVRVHRHMYQLVHPCEDITDVVVRHSCDTPLCINPDHLKVGTHKENTQDAVSRGRMAKGNAHGKVKVLEEDVPAIRQLLDDGVPQAHIAHMYGVSRFAIYSIKTGRRQ